MEAKGYPGTVYAYGVNKGDAQTHESWSTSTPLVCSGPIAAIVRQHQYQSAKVINALPNYPVYEDLIKQTRQALDKPGIGIYLICERDEIVLDG